MGFPLSNRGCKVSYGMITKPWRPGMGGGHSAKLLHALPP